MKTNLSDMEVITKAQNGSQEAINILCQRYEPLILHYAQQQHLFTIKEDVKSLLWLELLMSIQTYNPQLGIPIPAYFKSKIHYAAWNLFKKERTKWEKEMLKDGLSTSFNCTEYHHSTSPESRYIKKELSTQLRHALSALSHEEKNLIHLHYNLNRSLSELAQQENLTKQMLSYRHRQIIKKLKNAMENT